VSSRARARSLFICRLQGGIGMGHLRPGLAQPEPQLAEQPLTLPDPQGDVPLPLQVLRQGLAVPLPRQAHSAGGLAQDAFEGLQLRGAEARGSARTGFVHQARKPPLLESRHPVRDGSGGITEQLGHLVSAHALGNQQHGMEPVIVAGLLVSPDLILQGQDGTLRIGDRYSFHGAQHSMKYSYAQLIMTYCKIGFALKNCRGRLRKRGCFS